MEMYQLFFFGWFVIARKQDLDDTVAIHPTSAEGDWLLWLFFAFLEYHELMVFYFLSFTFSCV